MRCDAWAGMLLWWSCQSLVAHSCSLLSHLNSFRGGMFKLNAKFEVDSLLYLVILNSMATQYTCSLNGIYRPHWLVQWSWHCSCMCIPVHSLWLPGYISVMQTILVILTMARFFWTDLNICHFYLWMCFTYSKTHFNYKMLNPFFSYWVVSSLLASWAHFRIVLLFWLLKLCSVPQNLSWFKLLYFCFF